MLRNYAIFEKYVYSYTFLVNNTKNYSLLNINFSVIECFENYIYVGTYTGGIFVLDSNLTILSNFSGIDGSKINKIEVLNDSRLFAGY